MRRLNDNELESRIHSFITRKFEEFPELQENSPLAHGVRTARDHSDRFRSSSRFSLRWHQPRVA
jgi:hypothetical protein